MKDSKIANLEAQRVSLFHKIHHLSEEELMHQPQIGKWSILQIITHIVLSEERSVEYVKKKTQDPSTLKPTNLKTWFLCKIMGIYLGLNLKAKAPKVVNPQPDDVRSLQELESRWTKARMELENLSKLSPEVLSKGIFKHPKVGYMNFDQMLNFFSSHYGHHLAQVNAIVETSEHYSKALAL
ncbi:MAG: DinB family protein [Salibacteraceae bacterium]